MNQENLWSSLGVSFWPVLTARGPSSRSFWSPASDATWCWGAEVMLYRSKDMSKSYMVRLVPELQENAWTSSSLLLRIPGFIWDFEFILKESQRDSCWINHPSSVCSWRLFWIHSLLQVFGLLQVRKEHKLSNLVPALHAVEKSHLVWMVPNPGRSHAIKLRFVFTDFWEPAAAAAAAVFGNVKGFYPTPFSYTRVT